MIGLVCTDDKHEGARRDWCRSWRTGSAPGVMQEDGFLGGGDRMYGATTRGGWVLARFALSRVCVSPHCGRRSLTRGGIALVIWRVEAKHDSFMPMEIVLAGFLLLNL